MMKKHKKTLTLALAALLALSPLAAAAAETQTDTVTSATQKGVTDSSSVTEQRQRVRKNGARPDDRGAADSGTTGERGTKRSNGTGGKKRGRGRDKAAGEQKASQTVDRYEALVASGVISRQTCDRITAWLRTNKTDDSGELDTMLKAQVITQDEYDAITAALSTAVPTET